MKFFLNIIFFIGILYSGNFNLSSNKNIIATGYGITPDKAIKNAFKVAIEKYVGVIIESETIINNDRLIKDEILTASNGFIKSYTILNRDKDNEIYKVRIKALVRHQKVINKIKSLNISIKSFDGKNIYANVYTKVKAKKDAEKVLIKAFREFYASLSEMLYIKYLGAKVYVDNEEEGKVPIEIYCNIGFNNKVYMQRIKRLEQTFYNLGAKHLRNVDSPRFTQIKDHKYFEFSSSHQIDKILDDKMNFAIIKKYKNKYTLEVWQFQKTWNTIFPFKGHTWSGPYSNYYIQTTILFENKNGEIIKKYIMPSSTPGNDYYFLEFGFMHYSFGAHIQVNFNDGAKIFAPILRKSTNVYLENANIKYKLFMNIEDLKNIDNIKVILSDKRGRKRKLWLK